MLGEAPGHHQRLPRALYGTQVAEQRSQDPDSLQALQVRPKVHLLLLYLFPPVYLGVV